MKSRFAPILLAVVISSICLTAGNICRAQIVLINGANQAGNIYTNNIVDSYIFTANAGDAINLRLGSTFFSELRLYGPDEALLAQQGGNNTDWHLFYAATNSGTFTVLVNSLNTGGTTGTYVLNLSQVPEPFIVPAGYGGGPLTNGASENGTITLGRQDLWTFAATLGDSISVRITSTNIFDTIHLYGPDGAVLSTVGGNNGNWTLPYVATNSGTFTVMADGAGGSVGTYTLKLSQGPNPEYLIWAQHYFGCTNCPQASVFADPDGNGVINYDKFASSFNPTNSAKYLHIIGVAGINSNTDIRVTYLAGNGDSTYSGGPSSRTNVLEFTTGTPDGSYSNNFVSAGHTNILSGGTGQGIVTNMVDLGGATNLPARYYRIEVIGP